MKILVEEIHFGLSVENRRTAIEPFELGAMLDGCRGVGVQLDERTGEVRILFERPTEFAPGEDDVTGYDLIFPRFEEAEEAAARTTKRRRGLAAYYPERENPNGNRPRAGFAVGRAFEESRFLLLAGATLAVAGFCTGILIAAILA